jgi:hypothetical protein
MDDIILDTENIVDGQEIMLEAPPVEEFEIIITEPGQIVEPVVHHDNSVSGVALEPIVLEEEIGDISLADDNDNQPILVKDKIPGAPGFDSQIQNQKPSEEQPQQNAEPEKPKQPKDRWDWAFYGLDHFFDWANQTYQNVPGHSGLDLAGLERAHAYMEKFYSEVRKAMRSDYDGILDHAKIKQVCEEIENGISALEKRINEIEASKKNKKASDENERMIKQAGVARTTGGIIATVPYIILVCAQVCIAGSISAGHDIKHIFNQLSKKYKFDEREKTEFMSLLNELGYPMDIIDRGLYTTEDLDVTSQDNPETQQNYVGG